VKLPNERKKLQDLGITMLLILLAIIVINKWNVIPSIVPFFSPKPLKIERTTTIVREIKSIAQLMSVQTYSEVVIDSIKYPKWGFSRETFKRNPSLPGFLNLPRIVLVVKGSVIAGVDLQKLTPDDVYVSEDSISINLPKAQILDVIVNPSGIETFLEKGRWTAEETTQVKLKAKDKILQQALELNALQKAQDKSKQTIETLLRNSGFNKIHISISPGLQ
jgi:hypothetical protein